VVGKLLNNRPPDGLVVVVGNSSIMAAVYKLLEDKQGQRVLQSISSLPPQPACPSVRPSVRPPSPSRPRPLAECNFDMQLLTGRKRAGKGGRTAAERAEQQNRQQCPAG